VANRGQNKAYLILRRRSCAVSKDEMFLSWFETREDTLITMRAYFPSDAANALPSFTPSS
jgi:hypothetical protein